MSQMKRYQQNLQVLAQLKNNHCSEELLKSYTGWGGLREATYTPEIYREIKKCLTPDEILSLKKTLKSAYYTPKEIVCFMYRFLATQGFTGGDILETSIGNGIFIEHMPEAIRKNSHITAVEIDTVTAQICQKLYPDVSVHTQGFETYQPMQRYDLIIGNPPYGSQIVNDTNHTDLSHHCIRHYFTAKSMRLLKQGGILAMVLPSYFLDNESKHVRKIIDAEGGELMSAYRLPDDLFADAKVTVDMVFLRKSKTANSPAWLNVRRKNINGYWMPYNEYYHHHPEHIIGKLAIVSIYNRKGLTCKKDCEEPFEKLHQCLKPKSIVSVNLYQQNVILLKSQLKILTESLDTLSQQFAIIYQSLQAISQKIAIMEKQLPLL